MSIATGHGRNPKKYSVVQNCNDRLPLDILEQIFIHMIPVDSTGSIQLLKLPPDTAQLPWVLGRVCSSWRRASRSIPKFWNIYIEFNRCCLDSDGLKKLECAVVEILPTNVTISVYVGDLGPVVPASSLMPFLPRITHLSWCCRSYKPSQDLLGLLYPGSFSRVKTLTFTLVWPAVITSLTGIFGETSRLESLELLSDSPAVLLLSDIPWHQLSLLKLSFGAIDKIRDGWHEYSLLTGTIDMTPTRDVTWLWMELAMRDPFRRMTSLTTLHLDLTGEYMDILLSCSFPWHLLKTFTLHHAGSDQPDLLTKFMKIIEKCTSLLLLDFQDHLSAVWEPTNQPTNQPLLLPDLYNVRIPPLEHLRVGYETAFEVIKILCSPTLSCLNICTGILLQDFYMIIEQCPCLETVHSRVRGNNQSLISSRTVIAPRLTSLTMKFLRGTHDFPAMLQAPLLKELVLKGSFPDPMIEYIPDLINSSNMGLERFSMNDNKISTSPSLEQFRKLSSALSACKNVDISDPHYPVEELMETTAATDLFPCAEKLWLGSGLFTVPIEFLVSWLESRLEEEATSGVAILREFKICYVEDFDDWPEQIIIEKKFRELEMRYGVVCRVSWVCLQ